MASEIRVDKINSLSGVGTVSLSPTGVDISGITTAETLKATTGIVTTLTANTSRATTGIVTSLIANTARATTGIVTTLTATTGIVTTFVTNTAKVGAAVTITESGIEASGIGITCANINGTQIGGRRNKIINGAMQVAQRGTSESSVSTTQYANAPDRWRIVVSNGGTWTLSQSTTSPNNFANSYKFDCTTADGSLGAGDFLAFDQGLEGLDLQGLGWGTSDAKSVTVSFHVRSNKTGTYTCELFQGAGGVGGSNILVSKSYTINAADTWEKKTITFSGNTAVAFTNDNSRQLTLNLWLAAGSNFTGGTFSDGTYHNANNRRVASGQVNLADSTSNEWYITGVQLEVGQQATPFEHRTYQEERHLCKRYYQRYPEGPTADNYNCVPSAIMACNNTTTAYYCPTLNPTMRSSPSFSTSGNFRMNGTSSVNNVAVTAIGVYHNGAATPFQYASVASGLTAGQSVALSVNNDATAYIAYDSEL